MFLFVMRELQSSSTHNQAPFLPYASMTCSIPQRKVAEEKDAIKPRKTQPEGDVNIKFLGEFYLDKFPCKLRASKSILWIKNKLRRL
jgi:hypothetical protein